MMIVQALPGNHESDKTRVWQSPVSHRLYQINKERRRFDAALVNGTENGNVSAVGSQQAGTMKGYKMKYKYVRLQFPQGGDFTAAWNSIYPAQEDAALYDEITAWFRATLPSRLGLCHFKTENGEAFRTMIEPAMALLERYGIPFDAVYTNTPGTVVAEDKFWLWTVRSQDEKKWEKSCGAIVFFNSNAGPKFVVVQEMAGAYSMPKGHMEGNETEIETAQREVYEEIGVKPAFLDGFRMEYEYDLPDKLGTGKHVTVFLAEVYADDVLTPREGEIKQIELLPLEEALARFKHESVKKIFEEAYNFITKRDG